MDGLIQQARNFLTPLIPQPKIISPIPADSADNMMNPAVLDYVRQNQAGEENAGGPVPTYAPFKYPANPHANPQLFAQQFQKAFGYPVPWQQDTSSYAQATPTSTPSPVPANPIPKVLSAAVNMLDPQVPKQYAASPNLDHLTQIIRNGFIKWGGSDVPAASLSASFARAGQGLHDPLMPAVLTLKETGGGRHMADKNNLLNIQYNGIGNSPYEKPEYGIEGGGGHGGFQKVINNGLYNDYLKSGNLADFFKVYTPTYDSKGRKINDTIDDQIKAYNQIRSNFIGQ